MSDSVRPHRRLPTRLPRPWDSPGKNTGVGCHFLLQCMKVKSESEVAQSCPTLSDPMDCSLPGSSVHGIFQARILEWGAIAFSDLVHPIHTLVQIPHLNLPMGQSQVALVVKTLPANAGDKREVGSIPEWGRSLGGRHGNPLQYCCLENPKDRGAWQAIVHRVAKTWTPLKRLSTHTHGAKQFCYTLF